jgi:hypothetical protein
MNVKIIIIIGNPRKLYLAKKEVWNLYSSFSISFMSVYRYFMLLNPRPDCIQKYLKIIVIASYKSLGKKYAMDFIT